MKQILLLITVLLLGSNILNAENMDTIEKSNRNDVEIPIIGHKFIADFGDDKYLLDFLSETQLKIELLQGIGRNQTIDIKRSLIRPGVYMVTWQEVDNSTVTHLEDFVQGIVYTNITMPDLTYYNYKGTLKPADENNATTQTINTYKSVRQQNIDTVTRFLDLAFNKNDVEGASKLVTERYMQHDPYVADGKSGFIRGIEAFHQAFPNISWELKHVFVDGDYVITHSQYEEGDSYATVDIFRMKDGKIDEHWDVKEQIPAVSESANKNTMF